jgi:branched-subunit amino acid aminotransferase/4-amino-4-deoxychorismate lyase
MSSNSINDEKIIFDSLIKEMRNNGIDVHEIEISMEKFLAAEEVWMTSSTKEVQPVSKIDEYTLPSKNLEDSIWYKVLKLI